jgi:4-hydroxybenzoate polyprenyltransferase
MTHPTAVLIFAATVVIIAAIAERGLPGPRALLLLTCAMASAQAAVGLFNELFDYDLDRISKPWRALPAGLISARSTVLLALGLCLLALACAAALSVSSILLLALGLGMGITYSAAFKRSALSWLPYVIAFPLPPLWVWTSLGMFEQHLLYIYTVSVPFALAIHLCNQLRDFDQDLTSGVRGTVQHLGKRGATRLCYGLLLFSPLPAIALTLSQGKEGLLLLPLALLHWTLVLPVLKTGGEPPPEVFRTIFRRLQLSGPVMLFGWLMLAAQW